MIGSLATRALYKDGEPPLIPLGMLLTYILDIVDMLSRVPHVFQQNRYLSAVDMSLCYGCVVALLGFAYYRRTRRPYRATERSEKTTTVNETLAIT